MPKGIYIRSDSQREMLREKIKRQRSIDNRIGFKVGNKPKNHFNKGNKFAFKKGQKPWNKGLKNVQSFDYIRGKNHWNWRGGVTKERVKIWWSLEYKLWRKSVFERDNYTCIWCGARNGSGKNVYLEADHIKPFAFYPELRFAIDNGRTLCRDCHKTTETYGVRKNIKKLIIK